MNDHKKIDTIKEIVWNLLVYVVYFGYCTVMLLLFHLLTYSILHLQWTIKTILILGLIGSTIMMLIRLIRRVGKN